MKINGESIRFKGPNQFESNGETRARNGTIHVERFHWPASASKPVEHTRGVEVLVLHNPTQALDQHLRSVILRESAPGWSGRAPLAVAVPTHRVLCLH